ncbi:MAG: DUF2147 domain-containing protein [Steroidobacteraceae bacterium]
MRFLSTLAVLLLVLPAPLLAAAADARLASPAGLWEPMDSSGKPLGLIRIFEVNGLYYGRIEPSSPSDDRNARCTRCTDYRHNQPIIGLVLLRHLRPENGEYVGGDILDPDTGRIWSCELWLTDGGRQLIMRGYVGIPLLGRSGIWQRVG